MLRTGLSLACLPTALAVYREVRDSYKAFIMADLVVSWPSLLSARYSILLFYSFERDLNSSERREVNIALITLRTSVF
jgi:hypothetical protein